MGDWKTIITIGREYGAGGRTVAKLLSDRLGHTLRQRSSPWPPKGGRGRSSGGRSRGAGRRS